MISFTFGFNGYIDTIKGLQNNIINKKSQSKNNDMPILAKTPPINNSSIFGSLSKSIKSYLNF